MKTPILYRKRLIPMEVVPLINDRILYLDPQMIITAWNTLKPKHELAYGYSCYLPDQGFKISRFYNHKKEFMFWYCDIIDTARDELNDTYLFTDLLVDVEVYPDGSSRILDLDELSRAFQEGLLPKKQLLLALNRLHSLLQIIYKNDFERLSAPLLEWESRDKRLSV